MSQTKEKKSIWDTPLLSTKVKNANVKALCFGSKRHHQRLLDAVLD